MSAHATAATTTAAAATVSPTGLAALMQPAPGSLPATYVESDPVQSSQAKIAHLLGIFGILGTGIYYVVKKSDAGTFVRDQMKEAFNFHLLVFAAQVVLSIAGTVVTMALGAVGMIFSLASLAVAIGALVLSIMNAMKAGKGQVARYPARLSVLK